MRESLRPCFALAAALSLILPGPALARQAARNSGRSAARTAPLVLPAPFPNPQGRPQIAAGSLPRILPTSSVPLPSQSQPARQPRGSNPSLAAVARALNQDRGAGREFPSLLRLGSQPQTASREASLGEQRAAADSDFRRRADLDDLDEPPSMDASADAQQDLADDSGRFARIERAKGAAGGSAPVHTPRYPARNIRFNGASLPSVAFRPDRPVESHIVAAIDATRETLCVAAYEFKSREILKAVRRARERGVEVQVLLDYSSTFPFKDPDSDYRPQRSLETQALLNERFDVRILRGLWRYGILHNKFMLFDGRLAEFGSYNYSWTSEQHHYENSKFTRDKRHVRAFRDYWKYLRKLSVPFDEALFHPWPLELPPPPADPKPSVQFHGAALPLWFFSPGGSGEGWIVKAVQTARKSIDVSMFAFRSTRIAEALLEAKRRGVKVRVVLDRSQSQQDSVRPYMLWLARHRIRVRTLAGPDPGGNEIYQKNHNKFMVLDGKLVQTGSTNWTKNASLMSFENGHFTNDRVDAAAYSKFFNELFRKGAAVPAPKEAPALPSDEELTRELMIEPPPPPPPPVWPRLPPAPTVRFNGEDFPGYAARPMHPVLEHLTRAIDASKTSVRLALYEFNLPEVLDALRRARERGVDVVVLLDLAHFHTRGKDHAGKDRRRSPEIQALVDEGFRVRILRGRGSSGSMHNKFALFDVDLREEGGPGMAEFGSYNWAKTAEWNHFENIVLTREPERLRFYRALWKYLEAASVDHEDSANHDWNDSRTGPAPRDADLALELNDARFPRSAASPDGGVEDLLLRAIGAARASIEIAMFSFYSKVLADALLAAKKRGISVRLVLDRGQSGLMKLDQWFAYHDFDVKITAGPDDYGNVMFEKMHNKFMIVDGALLETGSFNYTPNAEANNFENANFLMDSAILAGYRAFFQLLYERGHKPRKPASPPGIRGPEYYAGLLSSFTE